MLAEPVAFTDDELLASVLDPDQPVSEDELAAAALAGDPDQLVPADAVAWDEAAFGVGAGPVVDLPSWYMPLSSAGHSRLHGWRRVVAWAVVVAFLAVVTSGLCSTYGVLEIA